MRKKCGLRTWALGMALSVILAGCGNALGEEVSSSPDTEEKSSQPTVGEVLTGQADPLSSQLAKELEEKGYSAMEEEKASRDAVITVGIYYNFVDYNLQKTVSDFNFSQDKYWLEIKEYDSYNNVVTDIMRGEGADIFSLKSMPFNVLAGKNVLEDLTPYFEESEVVSKERVLPSIWRAGSVDGKYMGVIPYFNPSVYLVEKGYTDNGGWTIEEYFALGDKYPNAKLEERVQDFSYYFHGFLEPAIQSYVNWEEKTCDFDSEGFRNLLTQIKENAEKDYETQNAANIAEQLYKKEYLIKQAFIYCGFIRKMDTYMDIRDTFLESYDMAGIPNTEGIPMYDMLYYEMYGMNARSQHKDAAWAFIEYLFSEEYQTDLPSDSFTVRADLLDSLLDSEINYVPEYDEWYHINKFTGEKIAGSTVAPFTEEDKERILYVIEHCYRNTMNESEIFYIIRDEASYFFEGDKSLDEVVKIIQNRATLYLSE